MNKEEMGLIKLDLIYNLMKIYKEGTGKPANHKNEKGEYVIIDFIKRSDALLKMQGMTVTLENDHEFIDKFFTALFERASDHE